MNLDSAVEAYAQFMEHLGLDHTSPGVWETPVRVTDMMEEMTRGLRTDAPNLKVFKEDIDEYVWELDIDFISMCEHHHAPFFGKVDIVYWPTNHVVGLSKLPRLVRWIAARPQLQERLTKHVASHMMDNIPNCKGVFVHVAAVHSCVRCRGVKDPTAFTATTKLLGELDKSEALQIIAINKGAKL